MSDTSDLTIFFIVEPPEYEMMACLKKRDSDYSMFVDSDVLFLHDNFPDKIVREGYVSCSMAASRVSAEQSIWIEIYGALDMVILPEQYHLMRRSRGAVIPNLSSGLVAFPEKDSGKGQFPDVWYETAQIVDKVETLEKRRRYLDQMTLQAAIRRAGLDWNILPEEQHYILGGKLRGKQLPQDRDIFMIHYRNQQHLKDAGRLVTSRNYLSQATGKRFVRRLAPDQNS